MDDAHSIEPWKYSLEHFSLFNHPVRQQNALELISAHSWEIELVKSGQFVYGADYVDTNQ